MKDLSALNRKLLGAVVERQRKRREQCEEILEENGARDIVRDLAHAMPYLLALSVAQELIGRLIDDPISWQRVECLIAALPDTDRDKLMLSVEKKRGWAVRTATAHRWVHEARRCGPKKSEDRLELLAFAKATHDVAGTPWDEILAHVNRIARELRIKRQHDHLDEDEDLFSSVASLRSAVCRDQNTPVYKRCFRQFEKYLSDPDSASDL